MVLPLPVVRLSSPPARKERGDMLRKIVALIVFTYAVVGFTLALLEIFTLASIRAQAVDFVIAYFLLFLVGFAALLASLICAQLLQKPRRINVLKYKPARRERVYLPEPPRPAGHSASYTELWK